MIKKRKTIPNRPDQDRKIKSSRAAFRLVLLFFLGALVYALFFSEFLDITKIVTKGNSQIQSDEIENVINEETGGKYLGVIKKNNLLVFPGRKISARLKKDFKKIRGVKVEKIFPDTVIFETDERQTAFLYLLGEKAWAIDETGVAYEEISPEEFFENKTGKIKLKGETGNEVFLNEEIAEAKYVSYVSTAGRKLREELGIETENHTETPNIISKDLRVKTSQGWQIYFNTEIPLEKELEVLKVFLDKSLKEINRSDLEYVDLRAENKIFYKLKNSEQKEEENKKEGEVRGEESKKVEEKKKKKK